MTFKETHGEGKVKKDDNETVVITKVSSYEVSKEQRIEQLTQIIADAERSIIYSQDIINSAQAELGTLE